MDVYNQLISECPYKENDKIVGTICDINNEMGAFVAIDNKYHGLIPNKELFCPVSIGETISGRITKIREDGKAYISIREKAYIQMDDDAAFLLEKLEESNGYLNLNDKSSPDRIKVELNMSKKAFKRAVGRLFKEKKIVITESGIKMIVKEE
jgi:predicted RNA-binding protein (virulence factor B family)